ncbi:MAG TPA: hypothetical protein VHM90_01485 [Phycisphaerae bacterium]|jgi:hypothetical protein|nr:hypothetical protein [Phycisphaerae bacterium]
MNSDENLHSCIPPGAELADEIYLKKVLRARAQPRGEKLLEGLRLFASTCEAFRAEIRMQSPEASPEQVRRLLRERFASESKASGCVDGQSAS